MANGIVPEGVKKPKFTSSGSAVPRDRNANIDYLNDMMRGFRNKERRLPKNKEEMNHYIRIQHPGYPKMSPEQFKNTKQTFQNRNDAGQQAGYARQMAAAGKRLSTLKDAKRKYEVRLKKEASEAVKLGVKEYEAKILGLPDEEYTKYHKLPSAEKQKQRKLFIDGIKKRIFDEDQAYRDVTAEMSDLKTRMSQSRPTRPQKERPSGGGTMTVEEDIQRYKPTTKAEYAKSGKRYKESGITKAGTVIITEGPWRGARQGKIVPTDDGRFEMFTRSTGDKVNRKPSMSPKWKSGGIVSSGVLYNQTKGQYGVQGDYGPEFDNELREENLPPRKKERSVPDFNNEWREENLHPQGEGWSPMLPSRESLQGDRAGVDNQPWGLARPDLAGDLKKTGETAFDEGLAVANAIKGLGPDILPGRESRENAYAYGRDRVQGERVGPSWDEVVEYGKRLLPRGYTLENPEEELENDDEYYGYDPYKEYDEYGERW